MMEQELSSVRSKPGVIIYWLFVYMCIACFLQKNLGAPRNIMFGVDVFYIYFVLQILKSKGNKQLCYPTKILQLLLISVVVGMFFNQSELSNFIWGIRSEFLCMTVLYVSVKYLTLSDVERIMQFFFKFQFLNLACAAYQYHVLGYYQDLNNGAFSGGAYQDVFCAILFAYYFYKYIYREDKLWKLLFVGLSGLYIAVVEEEKFIFIEFAGIVAYYFLSTGFNFTKIMIMGVSIIAGMISLPILNSINGQDSMEMLTSWDRFIGYATMVGYGYELPRLGSSVIISKLFFQVPIHDYFGLGLGMCEEASTISFIDSTFFDKWSWLHYMWFTFQIQFMQTGWIGIILYITYFIFILIANYKCKKDLPERLKHYSDFSIVMCFIGIALIWYTFSTRGYPGNFIYFAMSVGLAVNRQITKNECYGK